MTVIGDPERSRVVLNIWLDGTAAGDFSRCGFWAFDLKTRQWSQLLSVESLSSQHQCFLCDHDGDNVLLRDTLFVLNFDLRSNELTAVHTGGAVAAYVKKKSLQRGTPVPGFFTMHDDFSLLDGWLWSSSGRRLRLSDQTLEDIPGPNGEPRFQGIMLTRLPKRAAVLVSNHTSLVLYQQSSP